MKFALARIVLLAAAVVWAGGMVQRADASGEASNPPGADLVTVATTPPELLPADEAAAQDDPAAREADEQVRNSDRYMHQSKVQRGMRGYGLTVVAGTDIVRFDVEILSVMPRWAPHQDVILAKLSGPVLGTAGLAAGMSGSPVYLTDPADGKDKIIGAVAYGFMATKEPICGIQPIAQMLAIGKAANPAGEASQTESAPSTDKGNGEMLQAALNWRKVDYLAQGPLGRLGQNEASSSLPQLAPLATPLAFSGFSRTTMEKMSPLLRARGFMPVQGGGAGASAPGSSKAPPLAPGSALAVPLVSGDADMSAVGTVTDVADGRILAFGHGFFSQGPAEFPISQAYIHTIIPSLLESFKLGSATDIVGTLTRDESTGVSGVLGKQTPLIPVTFTIDWQDDGRKQQFSYQVARHRLLTPMLIGMAILDAAGSWRDLPELHTVRYDIEITFEGLGTYRASNISSDQQWGPFASDLLRPLVGVLNNPFSAAPRIEKISTHVSVESRQHTAEILRLELDGKVYRPGETVTGRLTLRPFRKDKTTLPVEFALPEDLAEGDYTLTACDATSSTHAMASEMPQRLAPTNLRELFAAMQMLVENKDDRLYLRMTLPRTGLALGQKELDNLPESRTRILSEAMQSDKEIRQFTPAVVTSQQTTFVLSGSAQAGIVVQKHPKETLIRQ
ncbi:MAG: hypothetical protein WC869_15895 [Phycisphaerae bacterium]|jgi:hypothetical protein